MRSYMLFAFWAIAAGAGIPLIGVLNSGLARSVGNPFAATAIMFAIALLASAGATVPAYGVPTATQIVSAPVVNYAGGLIIAFYALSATIIIPRFGAASFIAFILIAQLGTAAAIDQWGVFGMAKRPLDLPSVAGLILIVAGIAVMEVQNLRQRL